MVFTCYVCKRSSDAEPKVYMFKPPKDSLREWNMIIGRPDRQLKISHKICEDHFREDDIIRHDIFSISGKEVRLPKVIPLLKLGAVPKRWINPDDLKTDNASSIELHISGYDVFSGDRSNVDSPIFSFDELMCQRNEVFLPSEEWAVHKNGTVVSFVHVTFDDTSQNIVMDKAVIFTDSLTPTCTFNGIKSDIQVLCTSIDSICGVLKHVDSIQVCSEEVPRQNCKGYVLRKNATRCSNCLSEEILAIRPAKSRKLKHKKK